MDIQVIKEKCRLNEYTPKPIKLHRVHSDHIFNENMSVKWNREKAAEHNAKVDMLKEQNRKEAAELSKKLQHDVCCYITENYDLDYATASRIEAFCYTEWHSCMSDYFSYIDTVSTFVQDILHPEE